MCHLSKGPGGGLGKRAPQSLREFIPTLNPPSFPSSLPPFLPHLYSFSPPPLFTLLLVFSSPCLPSRPPPPSLLTLPGSKKTGPVMFLSSLYSHTAALCVCVCIQLCVCVCRADPLSAGAGYIFKANF